MGHGMESFVAICKAANPEFKSWSFERFEENYGGLEIASTCEVFGVLGLARKVDGWWKLTPHVHELLVEQAVRHPDDADSPGSDLNSIDNDPYLLRSIFIAASWEEENEASHFEFACNVLKALGLVVGGPSDNSWKPTVRLKSLVISRLVRSLKPDIRATEADLPEGDDQDPPPDDTWNEDEDEDEDEDYENSSGEEGILPESNQRRNPIVVGAGREGTGSISRLSLVKPDLSSA